MQTDLNTVAKIATVQGERLDLVATDLKKSETNISKLLGSLAENNNDD